MPLETICKPTRATCEKGPRCIGPTDWAHSTKRATNRQRRSEKEAPSLACVGPERVLHERGCHVRPHSDYARSTGPSKRGRAFSRRGALSVRRAHRKAQFARCSYWADSSIFIGVVDRGSRHAPLSVVGRFSWRTLGNRFVCLPRSLSGGCFGRDQLLRPNVK